MRFSAREPFMFVGRSSITVEVIYGVCDSSIVDGKQRCNEWKTSALVQRTR